MTRFVFFILLSISSVTYLIAPALTISTEGILGGKLAHPHQITYHAAVVRKSLENGKLALACNGAIIAKNFLLTIAQCFLNSAGALGNYEYSIIVDSINWKRKGLQKIINQIFLPGGGNYHINNIAVASLIGDLELHNNPYLTKVYIPHFNESFEMEVGKVSGFGHSFIIYNVAFPIDTSVPKRSRAGSYHFLRHADVLVWIDTVCGRGYTEINTKKQFCGKMVRTTEYDPEGLCDNDAGSPLVIDDKVVGLASATHFDCDDTVYGTAYTKVSAYDQFINSTINNNPLPDTIILNNNFYVPLAPAFAA